MVYRQASEETEPRSNVGVALDQELLAQLDNFNPDNYDPRGVSRSLAVLREAGVLQAAATAELQCEGHADAASAAAAFARQLDLLYEVGRGSLPLGRIFEGHVNALELIARFADGEQKERWYADAAAGELFGVWNTEAGDGLRVKPTDDPKAYRLEGAKTFCSGAEDVTRPIISGQRWDAERATGWQMLVYPMQRLPGNRVDASFWSPLGMQASASHRVDFDGLPVADVDLLGEPNDYHRQPHFSGGAVRFAAVQLGGAQALYEHTRALLVSMRRERDPYQCHRLGRMEIAVQSGRNWMAMATQRALPAWHEPGEVIHFANMMRTATLDLCTEILDLCEQAVGARGFLAPKPIQRIYSDLRMYLRQPAPDNALAAVGHYASSAANPAGGPL